MSVKYKTTFICENCGAIHSKWGGKCEECGAWNSIIEQQMVKKGARVPPDFDLSTLAEASSSSIHRMEIGIEELDRVLGGGVVTGSTVLLGGEPGVGKSTLLLQLAEYVGQQDTKVLYISGEESTHQISIRAQRLGVVSKNIKLASLTSLKQIIDVLNSKAHAVKLLIIDSIQTLHHEELSSSPGTVSQIRQCAFELIKITKQNNIALFLVGHITKGGQIAGPKLLEHMVDAVLYFEGEVNSQLRLVRAVKNRFGATGEIGVFEMEDRGLVEVSNPSASFLINHQADVSGCSIYAGIEGTRPILLEIQALVVPTFAATPRRAVVGWDHNRLAMIVAILCSRLGLKLHEKEIYLNVAGGLKVNEPAADLSVTSALISAFLNKPLANSMVFIGEVGLSGEVRQVSKLNNRINEAKKLGFSTIVLPRMHKNIPCNAKLIEISHIRELKKLFVE